MARLYADEDFDRRVVEALRRLGHDVLTVQEAGQANRAVSDAAILVSATTAGRVLVTHNRRHFIRLHREGQPHSGILVCTRDPDPNALAARIHQALTGSPVLDNQLIRIYRPQVL
jgi:predicted nuclease of predicted toxin-antitoxin system